MLAFSLVLGAWGGWLWGGVLLRPTPRKNPGTKFRDPTEEAHDQEDKIKGNCRGGTARPQPPLEPSPSRRQNVRAVDRPAPSERPSRSRTRSPPVVDRSESLTPPVVLAGRLHRFWVP